MKIKDIEEQINRDILPFVSKPGRYLGNEINVIHKKPESVDLRFAIAFPEVYEIGMASQAVGILYHQLNRLKNVWAERVFAPWTDMEAKLRENSMSLFSLESFTPLAEFDIIGFTLQYELTYTNIINMLDLSGIPIWAKNRDENDPLIIAGGPCACNPEPVAPFVDLFYIGDAEEGLDEFCSIIARAKNEEWSRADLLTRLAGLRGIYVPRFYTDHYDKKGNLLETKPVSENIPPVVHTRITKQLKNEHYPEYPLVPLIEVTHDRLAVEVMRGCTEGCRYCNAGMIYRPIRERTDEEIVEQTVTALKNSGFEEISFLSLSISDYSALNTLMRKEREALRDQQVNISFPSMRLDSFSEEIAEFARMVRKSGFTFAPEAGSMRMRHVINKNITDEDLFKAIDIALENGWKTLKFYFMIGLPSETKEDVEAIADLIEQAVRRSKKYGRIRFTVSISPHSPKSHTPFQWEKQDTKEELKEKIDLLRRRFNRVKAVNFTWREPSVSEIECILGRGDRRMADVIYGAWADGARFDGWTDQFDYQRWVDAFAKARVDMDQYRGELNLDATLPWDHVDKGVKKNYLLRERKNAYAGVTVPDCKDDLCLGCGIQRKNLFREFADCYIPKEENSLLSISAPETKKNLPAEPESSLQTSKEEFVTRYRLKYTKAGYARYLSHLDVVRLFERVCRRAGIKPAYSKGFNARPKISFGPALSLGFTSEAEYLDMEILHTPQTEIVDLLNRFLPNGLHVIEQKIGEKPANSLSACINAAEYQVELPDMVISQQVVDAVLKKENIPVIRTVKGKTRQINIRPYIETIDLNKNQLTVRTRTVDGRTVRMDEILQQFCHLPPGKSRGLQVHRKHQYIEQNNRHLTPMDVV